jgi:hypothetical protein
MDTTEVAMAVMAEILNRLNKAVEEWAVRLTTTITIITTIKHSSNTCHANLDIISILTTLGLCLRGPLEVGKAQMNAKIRSHLHPIDSSISNCQTT